MLLRMGCVKRSLVAADADGVRQRAHAVANADAVADADAATNGVRQRSLVAADADAAANGVR